MKRRDSWDSEFRKKKFYDKQYSKRDKQLSAMNLEKGAINSSRNIAVMLDLDGTCDFIDDKKAAKFVRQLECLRLKFGADYATISISTYHRNEHVMQNVLEILGRNLNKNVRIGKNFFYGGIYDYESKEVKWIDSDFNSSKIKTFKNYCLDSLSSTNQWFAIIDDDISREAYKKFKDRYPMVVCCPSQHKVNKNENNFMNLATETKGFDGVIEMLDEYIQSIEYLNREKVLEMQRNLISHLSGHEVVNKIRERDYEFLIKYFEGGYADETDYQDTLMWLGFLALKTEPTLEEIKRLRKLISIIGDRVSDKESLKVFEKSLNNFS